MGKDSEKDLLSESDVATLPLSTMMLWGWFWGATSVLVLIIMRNAKEIFTMHFPFYLLSVRLIFALCSISQRRSC